MRTIVILLLLLTAGLAGCAGKDAAPEDDGPALEVTETTGGIRGVVVDEALRPLEGITVRLHTTETTQSDAEGLFQFTGLEPGEYFLTAQKLGYMSAQTSAVVIAGIADPPAVKLQLHLIPGKQPYVESIKMEGYYECAMSSSFVTDSCDFGYRTAYDVVNQSQPLPTPRSVQAFHNTEFIDVAPSVETIIQEAFWDDPQVSQMKISLDATPIDAACDCSNSYMEVDMGSPTYNRLDGDGIPGGETAAVRGFLPFGDPQVATNFSFVIITTLFHNHQLAEGWTFETRDQYPVG